MSEHADDRLVLEWLVESLRESVIERYHAQITNYSDPEIMKLSAEEHGDIEALLAHVEQLCQRREAAARGEVVGTGVIVNRREHLNSVEIELDGPESAARPLLRGIRITLTRRTE